MPVNLRAQAPSSGKVDQAWGQGPQGCTVQPADSVMSREGPLVRVGAGGVLRCSAQAAEGQHPENELKDEGS